MGVTQRLSAMALAACLALGLPQPTAGFTDFGPMSADASFGRAMTFRVELVGAAPDRLELLLRLAGDDATVVAPVQGPGATAEYVWDVADRHVTPNTRVTYRWRATHDGSVRLSEEGTLLYDDDRPGLDWRSAALGEATVHWYGGAESLAGRLGELSADGVARAEQLLGHEMAGPVDIFVYLDQEDFFGALGPGAREWTGAATYPALRTIFMGPGDQAYLERTIVHEATHVVFNDATDNPFHEPAKWFNEGVASWSETQSAASERTTVEREASGPDGLFAFEAIAEQFPIGTRGSTLAYAQGAAMVDMIIAEHGPEAVAAIAEAYRAGASDPEALEAGTGVAADELYARFYSEFGADEPQPVEAVPIPPSNVRKPGAPPVSDDGSSDETAAPQPDGAAAAEDGPAWLLVPAAALLVLIVGAAAWGASRRRRTGDGT